MMRGVEVVWDQEAGSFQVTGSIEGHGVTVNAPGEPGRHTRPTGFSAADLLLAGMGSCSLWDVVEILRKSRQTAADVRVHVTAEQEADPPWTFRRVHLHYTFVADALERSVAERAVRLSVDRYCSVIATVRHAAQITDSLEILPATEDPGSPA